MFVLLFHYWEGMKGAGTPIFQVANAAVVLPAWLEGALGILLVGVVGLAPRSGRKGGTDGQAIEPNTAIVEANIVTPSFADPAITNASKEHGDSNLVG